MLSTCSCQAETNVMHNLGLQVVAVEYLPAQLWEGQVLRCLDGAPQCGCPD